MAPVEQDKKPVRTSQRKRSIALGLILGAVVLVFYVLTIVKMGPGIMDRPL